MSENGDNRDSPIHGNQTIGKMIINEWIGLWLCGYGCHRANWECPGHSQHGFQLFEHAQNMLKASWNSSISIFSLRKLPFASSISALQALIAKAPDADWSVTLALWTVLRGQVTHGDLKVRKTNPRIMGTSCFFRLKLPEPTCSHWKTTFTVSFIIVWFYPPSEHLQWKYRTLHLTDGDGGELICTRSWVFYRPWRLCNV